MKLTIIGAGPGGYETALSAARHGIEVTLVSDGPLGGTCLNEGCIPTKALCRAAEVFETCKDAAQFGIDAGCTFDFQRVMARKEAVVSQLRDGVAFLMKHKLITLVYGRARFVDAHTVRVALAEGGETEIVSDFIFVATGSEPASLPIPGAELPGVVTSREILSLSEIPARLCVIGAGVIGLEFASVFASFGTEVTVVEYCRDILPRFDVDLSKRLKQSLSKRGICIETSAEVQEISRVGDALEVHYLQKDKPCSVVADRVLMAVGRRPALSSMNFDETGIACDRRGVKVNGYMQTSVPSVYAFGDIVGGMMLAHAATFQGIRALNHVLAGQPAEGAVDAIDLSLVPAAVFTRPEAAMVGMTEEECKEKELAYKAFKSFYRANGKALSLGEPDGFCKILAGSEDGRLLGCHLFGAHAADLVHEVAALMSKGATLADLQALIHAHPTLSEVIQAAAHA